MGVQVWRAIVVSNRVIERQRVLNGCDGTLAPDDHGEQNHQGLENALIDGISQDTDGLGRVARRERLSGLLSFYCREAA